MKENGPCRSCDTWESLEVDHIDPKTKAFNVNWAQRWEVLEIELKKCQPLCSTCHTRKTIIDSGAPVLSGKVDGDFKHGTRWGYEKFGCRCQECKDETNAKARARKKAGKYSRNRHYTDPKCRPNQSNNYHLTEPVPKKVWAYQHGRETAYRKHGCRCELCVQWYLYFQKKRHDQYKASRAAVSS